MSTEKKPFLSPYTISDKVKDYSNDPLVLKKSKMAREFVDRVGFPKEFVERNHS